MLYKIIDSKNVESTETTKLVKENNITIRIPKTKEELLGFKPMIDKFHRSPSPYQNVDIYYTETEDNIIKHLDVVDKPTEEIVMLNEEFWAREYVLIASLLPKELYASLKSHKDGESYSLYGTTWASLLGGIPIGFVTYDMLELFVKPDMTKPLTEEVIRTGLTRLENATELQAFMGFVGQSVYTGQHISSVI